MKSVVLRYLAAFSSGMLSALIPILLDGNMPTLRSLIAAIGAGLLATGLFRCPSPHQPT